MSARISMQDNLREFIEVYRSEPALWRVKSKAYRDKEQKAAAYERLLAKLREVEPEADTYSVVKKINTIRSPYRKEAQLLKINPKYKPTLWYFNLLDFLKDAEKPDEDEEGAVKVEPVEGGEEDIKPCKVPVRKTKTQLLNKRKVLREFIQLYESEPALWKVNSKQYRNRELKAEAYQKLANKLKEIQPDADAYAVVKQINSLRSPYRKEIKKIRANPSYRTTLWYFDLLAFLDNEGEESSEEDEEEEVFDEKFHADDTNDEELHDMCEEEDYMVSYKEFLQSKKQNNDRELDPQIEFKPTSPEKDVKPPRKIQRLMIERLNEPETSTQDPLNVNMSGQSNETSLHQSSIQSSFVYQQQPEDRFDVYGKNVAMKLRQLPNDQRMLAEKAINDVLFEAEMGTLQRAGPAHYAIT